MLIGVFKHTSNVGYKYILCNFSGLGIVNRLYMFLLRAEGKGTIPVFSFLSFLI